VRTEIAQPASGAVGRGVGRAFDHARAENRAALITFLAAGDPDLAATERLACAAAGAGADMIELGIPFTDPLADGPVIQAAYTRALNGGVTVNAILTSVERIARGTGLPIVLMTAFNPVLARGVDRFCRDASAAGAAGVLVPDLLPEDAGELCGSARRHGLDTVFLAAPGAPERRLRAPAAAATGFLYLVSRRGVTGAHGGPDAGLESDVARARAVCTIPLAVGFGVSTAADAARVAAVADGVIVGSALVAAAAAATGRRSHTDAGSPSPGGTDAAAVAVREVVLEIMTGIKRKDR
jgi:tryptophan synthase alpha chain